MDELYRGLGRPAARSTRSSTGCCGRRSPGGPARYRRYDWQRGEYAETVTVPPAPLLVLEGVGSGSLVVADLVTVLVWIEAPDDVRMARGIERDGDAFAPYWEIWAAERRSTSRGHRTRERADLHLRT